MRLKWIELTQFCRFEQSTFRFGYGVTGIVGPNYVGKSSLLAAIAGSLTGDFGKPKERCINREASSDEPSSVRACWDINGQDVIVYRDMRSSKTTLTAGKEVVKSVSAVQERLREMLGVAESVIADYVFVPQDQLYGFLSSSVTERVETFASLCGVARAEKIHKLLGDELSLLGKFEIDESLADSQHARYRAALLTVKRLSRELAELKPKFKTDKELDRFQELLLKADRIENLETELVTAKDAIDLLDKEQQAVLDDPTEVIERLDSQLEQKNELLMQVNLIERMAQDVAESKPENFVEVPKLLNTSLEKLTSRLVSLAADIERLTRLLQLHDAGYAKCPTCDSDVQCDANTIKVMRASLTEKLDSRAKLMKFRSRVESHQAEHREYLGQQKRYAALSAKLKEMKADKPEAGVTSSIVIGKSIDQLRSRRRELVIKQKLYTEHVKQSHRREQTRRLLLEKIETTERELVLKRKALQLGKLLAKISVLSETQLSADRTTHIAYRTLLERKRAALSTLRQIQAEIDEQEVRRSRFEKFNKFSTEVSEARQLCHYSKLPQKIIHRLLQSVQRLTNEQLVKLSAGCQIVINENLAFQAVYAGGVTEPAKELSFGQKVLLALAFRFSLGKLFAKSCDISILDEPTVFLDKEHLSMFADLLKDLHVSLRQQQRQLFIVTHEETVLSSLPQVYELTHG